MSAPCAGRAASSTVNQPSPARGSDQPSPARGLGQTSPARGLGATAAAALSLALATPALADHPMANARTEGLSPLALALVTGGLTLAAVLLVVVIAMLLTRKPSAPEQAGE